MAWKPLRFGFLRIREWKTPREMPGASPPPTPPGRGGVITVNGQVFAIGIDWRRTEISGQERAAAEAEGRNRRGVLLAFWPGRRLWGVSPEGGDHRAGMAVAAAQVIGNLGDRLNLLTVWPLGRDGGHWLLHIQDGVHGVALVGADRFYPDAAAARAAAHAVLTRATGRVHIVVPEDWWDFKDAEAWSLNAALAGPPVLRLVFSGNHRIRLRLAVPA